MDPLVLGTVCADVFVWGLLVCIFFCVCVWALFVQILYVLGIVCVDFFCAWALSL